MNTHLKKLVAVSTFVAAAFAAPAQAAFLNDWKFDSNGSAAGGTVTTVSEWVDLVGSSLVSNTISGSSLSFKEVGLFTASTADSFTPLGTTINASFAGTGTGTLGGALNFAPGGTLSLNLGGPAIATFTLDSGFGQIDATGVPNGIFTLIFTATNLTSGYFFDSTGHDLSAKVAEGLTFGFVTTNASVVAHPPSSLVTLLATDYAGTYGAFPDPAGTLIISNNGQYRFEIPEPSALGLAGIALLGLGLSRRRKVQ
ncbi:MAG: hypothetical protein JWM03_879 [Rhodocyclales bacterium]|nr:hypothetical protein [Rhodocyclales bacterium]